MKDNHTQLQRAWDPQAVKSRLIDRAEALGFQKMSITDIDLRGHDQHFREWLAAGYAGEMHYLERNVEKRLNPALLQEKTCRVISARMNYLPPDTYPLEVLQDSSKAYISRYALGRDYHKVLRKKLAQLAQEINALLAEHDAEFQYRAFTDSAPVLEKALGEKAGLGWMGKHTLLLDQEAGSWFFLGEIYTNAPLPVDTERVEDACGKCNACMTVCPTQAIVGPRKLDARRCISYLTIEHKSAIPVDLRPLMGNRIYGCDDCQLFCPWNREAPTTTEPDFTVRHDLDQAELLDLFRLSEAEFLSLTEGSAMRRIGYAQWQRNIAIALGNGAPSADVRQALTLGLGRVNDMVDEHIRWALGHLERQSE